MSGSRVALGLGIAISLTITSGRAPAEPIVATIATRPVALVDRVVAIVGDAVIFRSDVVAREKPFVLRIAQTTTDKVERKRLREQAEKELLTTMIDEVLVAAEAKKRYLETSDAEIALALSNVAKANQMTVDELLAEVTRQGLSRSEYEDSIRRQIIEAKWLQLVVRPKIPKQLDEKAMMIALEAGRRAAIDELKRAARVEVRW